MHKRLPTLFEPYTVRVWPSINNPTGVLHKTRHVGHGQQLARQRGTDRGVWSAGYYTNAPTDFPLSRQVLRRRGFRNPA